mgnify:CR=1 FL=1
MPKMKTNSGDLVFASPLPFPEMACVWRNVDCVFWSRFWNSTCGDMAASPADQAFWTEFPYIPAGVYGAVCSSYRQALWLSGHLAWSSGGKKPVLYFVMV